MQYINYRENRRRGTAEFPLEYYHVTASHPQYVMSFHWHVEFELIRILSGSLTVTIDEIEFLAEAGDSIFIPAGSIHSGIPDDCVYVCLRRTIRKSAIRSTAHSGHFLMRQPPKKRGISL